MGRVQSLARDLARGVGGAMLALMLGPAAADELPTAIEPLARLERLDPLQVTVSGLSSGGFFAHQFHIVHSSLVSGAGILAGGPYACPEIAPPYVWPVHAATQVCTNILGFSWVGPRPDLAEDRVRQAAQAGRVDDPAALRGHRVWLFRGADDRLVPLASMSALESLYRRLGVPEGAMAGAIRVPGAEHGIPVVQAELACGAYGEPFVIGCGFDAVERLLAHLYDTPLTPATRPPGELGRMVAFDQRPFWSGDHNRLGLLERGYAYVPRACESSPGASRDCRLHVAFHGCRQNAEAVGDAFMTGGGYTRWAAENRIVVLFPQAKPVGATLNPRGCWDFWGYSSEDYRTRNAPQIRAVRAMIDAVLPAGNR